MRSCNKMPLQFALVSSKLNLQLYAKRESEQEKSANAASQSGGRRGPTHGAVCGTLIVDEVGCACRLLSR